MDFSAQDDAEAQRVSTTRRRCGVPLCAESGKGIARSAALLAAALLTSIAGSIATSQAQNQESQKAQQPPTASLSFVPFGAGLPTSGEWREGFRIADMNGDGHPDIVHGPPRKRPGSPPVIFLGDGKGSWALWKEARFPSLPYDYGDIEVADFNGDGHPDLALAVHFHGLLELIGDGKGGFTNAGDSSDGATSAGGLDFDPSGRSGFSSRALRALDWNGDGLPDLVAVGEGPRPGGGRGGASDGIVIYLNQGGPNKSNAWRKNAATLSPGIFSDSMALGDFDGDGHLDIATGSSVLGRNDLVNLWRAGGVAAPVNFDLRGMNHYVQAVGAGDFDGDGRDDLAVAYLRLEGEVWFSVIDVFFSRDGGKWERRPLFMQASKNVAVALASGRLRGSGAPSGRKDTGPDLVALTTEGETLVYLGDGHGGFTRNDPKAIPVYGGGCRGAHVALADLDGDGRDEIVASFADEPSSPLSGKAGPGCSSGGGIVAWKAAR